MFEGEGEEGGPGAGKGPDLAAEQSRSPLGRAARLALLRVADAGACLGRHTSCPFVQNEADLNPARCFDLVSLVAGGAGGGWALK